MPINEHVRIDEGVKRGPRIKLKPHQMETQARNEAGRFITHYSPELREQAVKEALIAIEAGVRVSEIAQKHHIPTYTLHSWLIGTNASAMRTQFFDGQCSRNLEEIREAQTPLALARAREELSGWLKVAAVRDFAAYGPKQEVTHKGEIPVLNITVVSNSVDKPVDNSLTIEQAPDNIHK